MMAKMIDIGISPSLQIAAPFFFCALSLPMT